MGDLASVTEHGLPVLTPPAEEWKPREWLFEVAPYDTITGQAYPLAPPQQILNPHASYVSWHHQNHSEGFLLSLGEIGRAIRTSKIQLALNVHHNLGPHAYHARVKHSHVPDSRLGKIRLILMNAANAVPEQVLDIWKEETRPIAEEERQRLFRSGEYMMQSDFTVRKALTRFAIDTGIDHLRKSDMLRYGNAKHEEQRKGIANDVIGAFIPIAFRPIEERYQAAQSKGYLPEGAPPNAAEVARLYVFSELDRFKFFAEAFERITEQRSRRAA